MKNKFKHIALLQAELLTFLLAKYGPNYKVTADEIQSVMIDMAMIALQQKPVQSKEPKLPDLTDMLKSMLKAREEMKVTMVAVKASEGLKNTLLAYEKINKKSDKPSEFGGVEELHSLLQSAKILFKKKVGKN